MSISKAVVTTMAAVAVSSCSGERVAGPAPIGDPVTVPVPAATPVPLRDIVIPNLPSPYYRFEYDATGRVATASFAAGFAVYEVTYDHAGIVEMENTVLGNHDRLEYDRDAAGRVTTVRYVDEAGLEYTAVTLTYYGRQLTRLERSRRLPGGFVVDKTMTFSYHPDGNLRDLVLHRPPIEGHQDETTTRDHFERYDDGLNVDAFSLLHTEFFDHLVLLPGVRLQERNPGRVTRTGDGVNYVIDYAYAYDDRGRPLTKTGDLTWLNGANVGGKVRTFAEFSYH